jgi:hypothetical protein
MASGQLRCFGSPLYLKSHYGVGYQLTIEKTKTSYSEPKVRSFENTSSCSCFEDPVIIYKVQEQIDHSVKLHRTVLKYIPQAILLTNTISELIFHLPLSSMHDFIGLLKKLDKEIGHGKASSYGLSITTLDQVFLKVSRGDEPVPAAVYPSDSSMGALTNNASSIVNDSQMSASSNSSAATPPPDNAMLDNSSDLLVIRNMLESSKSALFLIQMRALLGKRLLLSRRDKKTVLFTVLVPLLVTLLGFLLTKIISSTIAKPDLQLGVDMLRHSDADLVPVVTNAGDAPFSCQPGLCSVDTVIFENKIVNEAYVMCGYESRLIKSLQNPTPTSETCSLQGISSILSSMSEHLHVLRIDARNVTEVSQSFLLFMHNSYHCISSGVFINSFGGGVVTYRFACFWWHMVFT